MTKISETEISDKPSEISSLADLSAFHGDLLEMTSDDDDEIRQLARGDLDRIRHFLRQAVGLGTTLDAPVDRKQAQGLLDYWSATFYGALRHFPNDKSLDRLPAAETTLAPFDPQTIERSAIAVETWVSTLSKCEQEIVRSVILRLCQMEPTTDSLTTVPASRAAVHQSISSGQPMQNVDDVIERLAAVGVIRVTRASTLDADQITLRSPELLHSTKWPSLQEWLTQRRSFRQLSRDWESKRRPSRDLLRGGGLKDARQYHDRSILEQNFIEESWFREQRNRRLAKVFYTIVVGCLSVAAVSAALVVKQKNRSLVIEREAIESKKKAAEVQDLVDSGATLVLIKLISEMESDPAHRAKKVLIIQLLGKLVSADSDDAWHAAKENWDILEVGLKNDPAVKFWFRDTFFEKTSDGKSMQERVDLLAQSPTSTRAHRNELIHVSNYLGQYIPEPDPEVKERWYRQALECARELSAAAEANRSFDHVSVFANLFWRLYLGEMTLVESKAVAGRMKQFGDALKKWEQETTDTGKASRDVRKDLLAAFRKLKKAIEAEL